MYLRSFFFFFFLGGGGGGGEGGGWWSLENYFILITYIAPIIPFSVSPIMKDFSF